MLIDFEITSFILSRWRRSQKLGIYGGENMEAVFKANKTDNPASESPIIK